MQIVPGPGKAGRQKEKREQTKEQVQVLLLPIRHGANGLNLVEAQHVILMEPLLNPGAEAQAINRVHRIGQQHVTYVHRFIVSYRLTQSTILVI
jgi:E3 ubiquitin-protein ligase SHPRH